MVVAHAQPPARDGAGVADIGAAVSALLPNTGAAVLAAVAFSYAVGYFFPGSMGTVDLAASCVGPVEEKRAHRGQRGSRSMIWMSRDKRGRRHRLTMIDIARVVGSCPPVGLLASCQCRPVKGVHWVRRLRVATRPILGGGGSRGLPEAS